jgi:hypothetical protein
MKFQGFQLEHGEILKKTRTWLEGKKQSNFCVLISAVMMALTSYLTVQRTGNFTSYYSEEEAQH